MQPRRTHSAPPRSTAIITAATFTANDFHGFISVSLGEIEGVIWRDTSN